MSVETAIPVRVRSVEIVVAPVEAAPKLRRPGWRRSRRALLGFFGLALAANAALSLLLESGPMHLRDPEYGLRLKSLRAKRAEKPDRKLTVILGSSRTALGIRPDVYEAPLAEPNSSPLLFNMSMSGAGPLLQLLTLERLLADGARPDSILLEFWPAVLRGDGSYREDLRINAGRLRAADEPFVDEFFADSEATRARMRSGRLLPAWYHRRELLTRVWPETIPWKERADGSWCTLDEWGWLPGRKTATAEQIERGWPSVESFYAPLFRGFTIAPVADRALRACVARCRELGIAVAMIALPESARFRAMMPPETICLADEYRRTIERECDVPFLDGRTWAADDALPDGFHLTQDGATAFTRELAGHIARPR